MKKIFFAIALGVVFAFASTQFAFAASSFDVLPAGCTEAADSAVCQDKAKGGTNPLTGTNGLLSRIADVVAYVGGAAAVIIILVGAIRLITANSSQDNVASARKMIIGAVIGLFVIVFARIIIYFVMNWLAK